MISESLRRSRVGLIIVERRSAVVEPGRLLTRVCAATVAVAASLPSTRAAWALALLIPTLAVLGAEISLRRNPPSRSTSWSSHGGRRAVGWLPAALLAVLVPSHVTTDLPFLLRMTALGAGAVLVSSVVTALFATAGWFDPDRSSRAGLELVRRLAGPLTAALVGGVVVSGPWPDGTMPAVWACALTPVVVGARLYGLDHAVFNAVPLIREQGQLGRDQVLREIHGALSTEMRQLEQHARDHRQSAPELYELAVSASSSLRETLTLSDEDRDTSTTTDTLQASVLTLTRAEGASVTMRVEVDRLLPVDRDVVRYVLHELVGDALRAGVTALDIVVGAFEPRRAVASGGDGPVIWVTVRDQGPDGVWAPAVELLTDDVASRSHELAVSVGRDGVGAWVRASWPAAAR